MKFLILVLLCFMTNNVNAKAFIIPTPDKYEDFLIEPFKPDLPSVVVFKDPNCGYCIKALKALDKYDDYNVYMFWSPILGESSVRKVDKIFECEKPSGYAVITSVINRSTLACEKSKHSAKTLKELNDQVVNNYTPQSVPSYYFGGQKVWLSQLNNFKKINNIETTSIKLNWMRYQELKLDQQGHKGLVNAIVFTSSNQDIKTLKQQLKTDYRYNWYIAEDCSDCSILSKSKLSAELALLFNVEKNDSLTLVISGVVIQPERYSEFKLQNLLASKLYQY